MQKLTIKLDQECEQLVLKQPYSTKNQSIHSPSFSKMNKHFQLNYPTTSIHKNKKNQTAKAQFQFKSTKYLGIIEKKILQRLSYYQKKLQLQKQTQQITAKLKKQQFSISHLQSTPNINRTSKQLYQKIKKQRKLSPNVLQRFKTYEFLKNQRKAKQNIQRLNGINIQNQTINCKKNQKQNCKSRSPLNQRSSNLERSLSCNASKKNIKNAQNIGKIVNRQKAQEFESQKLLKASELLYKQNFKYCSALSPKKTNSRKKKQFEDQNEFSKFPQKPKLEIKGMFKRNTNEFKQLSPLEQKKNHFKSKNWKLVV